MKNNNRQLILENGLKLIRFLRTGRKTGKECVEHMGFGLRTIHRYFATFEAARLPVRRYRDGNGESVYWIDRSFSV